MCIADMMRAREDVLRMQLDSALSKVEELKTENDKLRELVDGLIHTKEECENCECDNCKYWNHTDFKCALTVLMRELGIEVE